MARVIKLDRDFFPILPKDESLKGHYYYKPSQQGKEASIKQWLDKQRGQ